MSEKEDGKDEKERRYYQTRNEAESERNKGERIYYKLGEGFYLVRPKERDWWNIF